MNRPLTILIARIKCSWYCIWQALRYYNFVCEFEAYDDNNNLLLIGTTKDNLLKCGKEFKIDKIFYKFGG